MHHTYVREWELVKSIDFLARPLLPRLFVSPLRPLRIADYVHSLVGGVYCWEVGKALPRCRDATRGMPGFRDALLDFERETGGLDKGDRGLDHSNIRRAEHLIRTGTVSSFPLMVVAPRHSWPSRSSL